ncbi:hypothetical protein [Nocardiopsis lambiniae]|uniref:Uncharacterized protein n=1 Tax=Nocardiopsis lambiniae TaxID=3075539 RepID=A0ABU2MCG4_9ACTN|nr:hypothetical protein [Nocardiopsis sp. DSM 44743]MDT0330368.1 hypothetical protein [Nocardiopsis sp. DSM 44743]
MTDVPEPLGVTVRRLDAGEIDAVLDEVFVRGVRSRLLDAGVAGVAGDPEVPQWMLAELGDGRITGVCPRGHWHRSDGPATADLSARPPVTAVDRVRVLEVLVFAPHAQIRVGEGARAGWISGDAPGELPSWSRPRDRSFLLQGWTGPGHGRSPGEGVPLSVTAEPSGARAVLPVLWAGFSARVRRERGGRAVVEGTGSWLTVREYWAQDPETGAVGVAFHRLTGVCTGPKPTGPVFDPGTGDEPSETGGRGPW